MVTRPATSSINPAAHAHARAHTHTATGKPADDKSRKNPKHVQHECTLRQDCQGTVLSAPRQETLAQTSTPATKAGQVGPCERFVKAPTKKAKSTV